MIDGLVALRQVSPEPVLEYPRRRRSWGLLTLVVTALASGCGEPPGAQRLERYVTDLQQTLNGAAAVPDRGLVELSVYPGRRSVRLPVDDLMISVFDFFAISRRCGLGTLVAERNSSLGLVMADSQRFVYEQALLVGLRDCHDRLRESGDHDEREDGLQSELNVIIERKSRELPRVFWNATFASEEFEALFSLSGGDALGGEELGRAGAATVEALGYLQAVYRDLDNRDRAVDGAGLEAHLNNIRQESYGGRVLKTLRDLQRASTRASELLEAIAETGFRCEKISDLKAFYESQVEGWFTGYAGEVESHARAFLEALAALADLPRESVAGPPMSEGPRPFAEYRRRYLDVHASGALFSRLGDSLQRHQNQWQRVLADCR